MPVKLKGEDVQDSSKASIGVWSRDMGSNENPTKETGCEWDEDAEVEVWRHKER